MINMYIHVFVSHVVLSDHLCLKFCFECELNCRAKQPEESGWQLLTYLTTYSVMHNYMCLHSSLVQWQLSTAF